MAELPSQESTPPIHAHPPSFFHEDEKKPPRTTIQTDQRTPNVVQTDHGPVNTIQMDHGLVNVVHPFEHHDDFESHPPIPLFNIIIRSKTGEVVENRTGRP